MVPSFPPLVMEYCFFYDGDMTCNVCVDSTDPPRLSQCVVSTLHRPNGLGSVVIFL